MSNISEKLKNLNGEKASEGNYNNGQKVGEWIYYQADGFIKYVENYD